MKNDNQIFIFFHYKSTIRMIYNIIWNKIELD